MIMSRLSRKPIFSIPLTTSLIADRFRIVIKMARRETSVCVDCDLNLNFHLRGKDK